MILVHPKYKINVAMQLIGLFSIASCNLLCFIFGNSFFVHFFIAFLMRKWAVEQTEEKFAFEKIDKQKSYVQLKLSGFCYIWLTKFVHPVSLEPEVTGGWYSGLYNLIGCTLCVLGIKTIGSDSFFWVCDFTWNNPAINISYFLDTYND